MSSVLKDHSISTDIPQKAKETIKTMGNARETIGQGVLTAI